jgi:protocatechuate 3,4-dioxygenase beta subunit
MRVATLLTFVILASAAPSSQTPELIPAPYLSSKYVAPANAPSSVVVAGNDEPGERFIVTGQVLDGTKPLPGVSIYVFQADADGLYTKDASNSDQNARLHGAMRSDASGRYRFETIKPKGYGGAPAHVHYVLNERGYKPRMFDLWLADDPLIEERRKAGTPVPGAPGQVVVRPVTRDTAGVWHATRDLEMLRE